MQNIIASFSSHVTKLVFSDSLRQVIGHLFKLYALHNINLNQADFIKVSLWLMFVKILQIKFNFKIPLFDTFFLNFF